MITIATCFVYLYAISYQPAPLGLRVIVYDRRQCKSEEYEMGKDICARNGYARGLKYIYYEPYLDHYHAYCEGP